MANFAVNAPEEVIEKGNELLNKIAKPGERKADALNRLFDIASNRLDDEHIQQGGCDEQALEASFTTIRRLFLAVLSGKEQIVSEKDARIADMREKHRQAEDAFKEQLESLQKERDAAIQESEKAEQIVAKHDEYIARAKEQTAIANRLLEEKDTTIQMLTEKLNVAKMQLEEYAGLREAERRASEQVAVLTAEMKRKLSEAEKEKELAVERAVASAEKAKDMEIRKLDKENARMQAKLDLLGEQVN